MCNSGSLFFWNCGKNFVSHTKVSSHHSSLIFKHWDQQRVANNVELFITQIKSVVLRYIPQKIHRPETKQGIFILDRSTTKYNTKKNNRSYSNKNMNMKNLTFTVFPPFHIILFILCLRTYIISMMCNKKSLQVKWEIRFTLTYFFWKKDVKLAYNLMQ